MSEERLDILSAEEFDMEVQLRVDLCDGSCKHDCYYTTVNGKKYCWSQWNPFA